MVTILFADVSIFVFRFRGRAALELKLVALQHQLAVLRRQRPGRPQLSSLDRILWVLLYRIWPLSFPKIISGRTSDASAKDRDGDNGADPLSRSPAEEGVGLDGQHLTHRGDRRPRLDASSAALSPFPRESLPSPTR